ncbi:hypothetical protein SNE35_07755 [Paucibacter sp. R3-3]|uniref:Uncharacterized protein n=1 Tax=Roseateles agri TaxID=3098619 RepID=A0ABU5DDN1_9BURK|nr:hypothetical protein [Paucibacter sp. R3-3]MDY0744396.1 hypothetical protein [Paucibacter sp. R3-3]
MHYKTRVAAGIVALLAGGCAQGPSSSSTNTGTAAAPAQQSPGVVSAGADMLQSGVKAVSGAFDKITAKTPLQATEVPIVGTGDVRIAQLFQKHVVSGKDLLPDLVQIRTGASARGGYKRELLGPPGSYPAPRQDTAVAALKQAAADAGLDLLEQLLNRTLSSGGTEGLTSYLSGIESSTLLRTEAVELPQPGGLTIQQKRRIVSMAAMLVAIRVSNQQLAKAREDFAGVEADYARMIERRETAAQLLYEFLQQGGSGRAGDIGAEDMAWLRARRNALTIQQFATDMEAQNLALRYLRQKDPAAWQDYRNTAERASKRTTAYVRTMLGGVAFSVLARNFGRDVLKIYKGRQPEELLVTAPLVLDFGVQLKTTMQTAWDLSTNGLFADLGKAFNPSLYRWDEEGKVRELGTAKQVFESLDTVPTASREFRNALVRDGSVGLIYRVYLCDKGMAGRLVDAAVPAARRDELMRNYLQQPELNGYSFAAAFEAPAEREKDLAAALLSGDQRRLTSDRTGALAELQRSLGDGYAQWNNDHLLRLIFANREGAASHAALQVDRVWIRAVPSMQSIYAYEAQVEGCKAPVATSPAKSPTQSTPKPPAAPASAPRR